MPLLIASRTRDNMLTAIGEKKLKKHKKRQYLMYDEIKVHLSPEGLVELFIFSKGACISVHKTLAILKPGDTMCIQNISGELEVNLGRIFVNEEAESKCSNIGSSSAAS